MFIMGYNMFWYICYMKVISCNIGEKIHISWRGKNVYTGIFKKPVSAAIFLGKTDVKDDIVYDRKYHGGIDKACYIYGANNYTYWREMYPNLNIELGFFGENITVEYLDESKIFSGDIYQLGEAIICVTDPREPCYKLGIRFEDQKVLNKFRASGLSGTYLSVIKEGFVKIGDEMTLIERKQNEFSLREIFLFRHDPPSTKEEMHALANNPNFSHFAYKKWPIKVI